MIVMYLLFLQAQKADTETDFNNERGTFVNFQDGNKTFCTKTFKTIML